MKRNHLIYMDEADDAAAGGGGGTAVEDPPAPAAGAAPAKPAAGAAAAPAKPAAATGKAPAKPAAGAAAAGGAAVPAAGGEGAAGGAQPNWPETWRDLMAGGDAKKLATIQKYGSPAEVANALLAARQRISEGMSPKLTKDATAEQLAEFRTANGIPETPDKYDLDLGADIEVGANDKELVENFLKAAHAEHMTPAQVKVALRAYYDITDVAAQRRNDEDVQLAQAGEDAMHAEWGKETRRNLNMIAAALDMAGGKEFKDNFLRGRLADGTPIGSSLAAMKYVLGEFLKYNPRGTLVGAGGEGGLASAQDERKKILDFMAKDRKAYNKDDKMQARLLELNELISQQEAAGAGKKAA